MRPWLASLMVAALLGTMSCATQQSFLATAPVLDLRPAPGSSEAAVQRAALLNIHAYVEQHREPLRAVLRNVTTMSPVEAARVVARDESWHMPFRRRMATVRLVAHARDEADAIAAVDVLLGSVELRRQLLEWLDAHPGVHDAEPSRNVEEIVAEGLREVLASVPGPLALTGACTSWSPASNVTKPNDYTVKISVRADAGRAFNAAKPKIDPRNWGPCAPTLWADTYLVEVVGGTVQYGATGLPVPTTAAPPVGDDFTDEILYEHVICDGNCDLSLLLHVTATNSASPKSYLLNYNRPQQLSGSPSLIGDDGHVRVTKIGGAVEAESVKNLVLTSPANATVVYVLLKKIVVASYLEQVVCCS